MHLSTNGFRRGKPMISYRHDGLQPFRITVKNDRKTVGIYQAQR
jgi:hypothetical protein